MIAFAVASGGGSGRLAGTVTLFLCPLWGVAAAALVARTVIALVRRRAGSGPTLLEQLDVLTGPGRALAWLAAGATVLAVLLGWPSLAVVGLLGSGLFHAVVVRSLFAFPLEHLAVTRRFVPAVVTEGEEVHEELTFHEPRIPFGYRLLASSQVGPRFAAARVALEAHESGGEVVVESEIGPAVRGEHEAELVEAWLQDAFGLCRSEAVRVGRAQLTVLPRARVVAKTPALLDLGDGPRAPRSAHRMPTEGNLLLREYQQGDDVRRIHWVRSLAAGEVVVRLPDELPPDQPHVRLVLDTCFPEASELACDTPAEVLDALVAVWLAVARDLAEAGARVTLAAAVRQGDTVVAERRPYSAHAAQDALRFGARMAWQDRMTVEQLVTAESTYVVSRAVLYAGAAPAHARWILVLPELVTEPAWTPRSPALLAYPMGTPDNRFSVRRRAELDVALARRDHGRTVMALRADVAPPPAGSFVVRYRGTGALTLEAVR
ncbi:MAG: hypothetical protein JWP97_5132 [Labilithrix sp.]|nr:hypothetical protein [Labilithrix sp.]